LKFEKEKVFDANLTGKLLSFSTEETLLLQDIRCASFCGRVQQIPHRLSPVRNDKSSKDE